jgi:hypothetical protein
VCFTFLLFDYKRVILVASDSTWSRSHLVNTGAIHAMSNQTQFMEGIKLGFAHYAYALYKKNPDFCLRVARLTIYIYICSFRNHYIPVVRAEIMYKFQVVKA